MYAQIRAGTHTWTPLCDRLIIIAVTSQIHLLIYVLLSYLVVVTDRETEPIAYPALFLLLPSQLCNCAPFVACVYLLVHCKKLCIVALLCSPVQKFVKQLSVCISLFLTFVNIPLWNCKIPFVVQIFEYAFFRDSYQYISAFTFIFRTCILYLQVY